MSTEASDVFEDTTEFPDVRSEARFDELVGLDEVKDRLVKESLILLDRSRLSQWSDRHHKGEFDAEKAFAGRNQFFVFAGDVGTGKTELAETFGDALARESEIPVFLFEMSLRARGSGSVGEMTQLISSAFERLKNEIPAPKKDRPPTSAGILLIDEADALAQSRELAQMHHEDRAGVNALIRGISGLTNDGIPVITVMCTNRLDALDPAILRRAADVFAFTRPSKDQRIALLAREFEGVGFSDGEIKQLAKITGMQNREYGFTYSDIRSRLVPSVILDVFPDNGIRFERVVEIASELVPTKPFSDQAND